MSACPLTSRRVINSHDERELDAPESQDVRLYFARDVRLYADKRLGGVPESPCVQQPGRVTRKEGS